MKSDHSIFYVPKVWASVISHFKNVVWTLKVPAAAAASEGFHIT